MTVARTADVAVVGLGGLGSAAAYWLARGGVSVVGFEQFDLGHVRGASHDHSRIIRRSYHTPEYVRLAAQAYDSWRAVEAESRERMITITGGVDLFPPNAAIDHRTYTASLDAERVPYEWIDGEEIRRRWPAFAAGQLVTEDVMGVYSPQTGIVPAGHGTRAMQDLAHARGAMLHGNTPVRAIRPIDGEVDIVTDDGVTRVGSVVITADAWTNRVLSDLDLRIPLAVLKEQVSYFQQPDLAPFGVGRFPVWIWMDDPSFYGFPVFGDMTAVKGAEDCGGREVDPDTRTFDADAEMETRLGTFMHRLTGGTWATPRTTTCLYTLTSDRDFVLDRLPGYPQISVALGAAHGFKFASWFGRTLAGLACGDEPGPELAPFAFTRESLHQPIDRAAWMV